MPLPPHEEIGEAETVEDYLRLVLGKAPVGVESGWMFRGQTNVLWPPLPKIDRAEYVTFREREGLLRKDHEERLMTEFELGARPHVRIEPRNPWEWLAVAQHHGLATRLLDWTVNPMAALFLPSRIVGTMLQVAYGAIDMEENDGCPVGLVSDRLSLRPWLSFVPHILRLE